MHEVFHSVEVVFRWILQTTWQTTVLIGLILLAQWLLRKRLAPAWRYGLWLLLIARLCMPFLPPSGFSIFNLARKDLASSRFSSRMVVTSPHLPLNNYEETPRTDFTGAKEYRRDSLNATIPSSGTDIRAQSISRIDWLKILCSFWLAGALFFASRLIWSNARFRSRIERHPPVTNSNALRLLDECRKEFKITRAIRIIESAEVESPGVYGLWRTCILLPEGGLMRFSREELRYTFLHELAHLKRRDLEVNSLTAFLQILHWFNPFIWLAFARMRSDRELATDSLVLTHLSAADNIAYGDTIIKVAANLAQNEMLPGLVGIAENKAGLQARLRAIAGAGTAKRWTWAAACAGAILTVVGLTGARGIDQPIVTAIPKHSSPASSHRAVISGSVLDVRGRPVNNAQVAVYQLTPGTAITGDPLPPSSGLALTCTLTPRIFNPEFGHRMAELSVASEPWNFCTTDAHGHFYLNDLDRALGVVVVSESGFGWSATNEFSANMTVKLEPWGRIEGTFWHYNEVVTNEPVRVFFALQDRLPIWDPDSGFNTKTDDRGHFSFDFVPPGHFGIESAGLGERITVKSGQTAVVTLGGRGRRVVGRFKIRNPDGKVEPADEFRYAFFTSTDIGAKTKEEWEVLRKQPIWEKAFTNFHARPVQCAKDGSFHIDQVEPGKYELFVETSSVANPNRLWLFGRRAVEITGTDPKIPEPLDVGLIELSLNSRSGANK